MLRLLVRYPIAVIALVGLFCGVSVRAQEVSAPEITQTDIAADSRLTKKINLAYPRICIGDLLREISAQSGVSIKVEDSQTIGGVRVLATMNQLSLADAMNALWSLCNNKGATYSWKKESVSGKIVYTFWQPAGTAKYADRLRADIQNDLDKQTTTLLNAAKMSPEELVALRNKDPDTYALVKDNRVKTGVIAFNDALPAERRLAVVRGQETVTLSLVDAPDSCRSYVQSEMALLRKINPLLKFDDPTHIHLSASRIANKITPTVWLTMGDAQGGQGGGLVGGTAFENGWKERLRNDWFDKNDQKTHPAESEPINLRKKKDGEQGENGFSVWLSRIGQGKPPYSVLARLLPDNQLPALGEARASASLETALQQWAQYGVMHKWRGDVLLLTSRDWMWTYAPDQMPPYSVILQLREVITKAPDGMLTPEDITKAVRTLDAAQIKSLGEEFPVMENVAQWRPLFALMSKAPRLLDRLIQGKSATLANSAVRQAAFDSPGIGGEQPWSEDDSGFFLTMGVTDSIGERDGKKCAQREIYFRVSSKDGKITTAQGFMQYGKDLSQ